MSDSIELRMNVAALKRLDHYALDIVDSATHVALYMFEDNEWEKTSIEGALFVYSRNGEPVHSMVIMNRLNTNNLIEPVSRGLELQLQEPFLLYRNSRGQIYGIWFYDKDECVRVATKLDSLVRESVKYNNCETAQHKNQASTSNKQVDIFSMLSKAQDDFNSNNGVGTKSEGNASRAPDVTSQSVMDFFAKAGHSGSAHIMPNTTSNLPMFSVPCAPPSDVIAPFLQRLMSNPAHSVEHIEKQQRSVTPQEQTNGIESNENRNKPIFKIQPNKEARNDKHIAENFINKVHKNSETNGQHNNLEKDLNFLHISSPKSSSPYKFMMQENQVGVDESCGIQPLSSTINTTLDTPSKPALMPPTMFASTTGIEPITPIRGGIDPQKPEPLTRNQLLQAFNYLLKHDADFINKLHDAYVKSFSELVL